MKEKRSGIYYIERIETGQKYVGKSENVDYRIGQFHHGCKYIYSALKKYGKNAFKRNIIEYCLFDDLDEREKYWIKELCSHVSEGGYNISWGGDGGGAGEKNFNYGRKQSDEHREKKRKSLMGHDVSEESRKKMSESGKGKHFASNETRRLMSINRSGTNHWSYGKKKKGASSKYYGVHVYRNGKYVYWCAAIIENKKKIKIGVFKTEIDAAKAYDKYVVENNLPRPLNFPKEWSR